MAEKLSTVQSRKHMVVHNGHRLFWMREWGWAVKVEAVGVSSSLRPGSGVPLERGRPAGGLSQQCWAQKQQQHGGGRGRQHSKARIGASAAPQLRFAAGLLALQACVGGGTAAADVFDAHSAILAALELVVAHPGCGGSKVKTEGVKDMARDSLAKVSCHTLNSLK